MESLQVLIVEDESLVSQSLVLMVSEIGHSVVGTVSDGESALREIREKEPDIVLVDLQGPNLDGLELTRQIMADYPVPVVLLSASEDQSLALEAADAGAFGYLQKPVSPAGLIPVLAVALRRFNDWISAFDELTQLRETLETRKAAEQAKGIIMQRLQLPEAQAYAHLREKCRNQQKTMKQASLEIIDAERAFLDQLSKEPPSRSRPRWADDRQHVAER